MSLRINLLKPRYIVMWSGPRNISTAMMRSWGNRADTVVIDEPFYAYYLQETEYAHPDADKIIAHYETDGHKIITQLTERIPDNKCIFYQKHMTHHMLESIDRTWLTEVTNCFLIRDPRRMILSFAKVIPNPTIDQMGLSQQVEIFHEVCVRTGEVPPVLSAQDVLRNPKKMLVKLCEVIDVPFDDAMLQWKAGRRETDGIWAKHWYTSVEKSTGFMPYQEDDTPVPEHLLALLEECQLLYDQMAQYCIH